MTSYTKSMDEIPVYKDFFMEHFVVFENKICKTHEVKAQKKHPL